MAAVRLLADEDFRSQIVDGVRRFCPGIEFTTVQAQGKRGLRDSALLEFAAAGRWIVVSHDVNTMRAAAYSRVAAGLPMAGLLLAPQHQPTRDIVESLVIIFEASSAEEWANQVQFLPY